LTPGSHCPRSPRCQEPEHRFVMTNLIILNGTCGAGKTTVAKLLAKELQGTHIEVDDILKCIKERAGKAPLYNSSEVYREIAKAVREARCGCLVLSSVFFKDDLDRLKLSLVGLDVDLLHVILDLDLETAIARTQERTCFRRKTPVEVTRELHQGIQDFLREHRPDLVVDSGRCGVCETVKRIKEAVEERARRSA
jgi:shikimate kinase